MRFVDDMMIKKRKLKLSKKKDDQPAESEETAPARTSESAKKSWLKKIFGIFSLGKEASLISLILFLYTICTICFVFVNILIGGKANQCI